MPNRVYGFICLIKRNRERLENKSSLIENNSIRIFSGIFCKKVDDKEYSYNAEESALLTCKTICRKTMASISLVTTALIVFFSFACPSGALETGNRIDLKVRKDIVNNKRARDIISSFLNAWKTSKIIPDYGQRQDQNSRLFKEKAKEKQNEIRLDSLDFLGQRKSQLDAPSLYALQNSFNPKPIKKAKNVASRPEAMTFIGKEGDEETDDRSPELKLASFVSKPIYHMLPASQSSEEDIKEFMFGENDGMNGNSLGLPNEDWQTNSRRSLLRIPGAEARNKGYLDNYSENNEVKKNDIVRGENFDDGYRTDNAILDDNGILEQLERRNIYNQLGDKKELITDPYDSLSLPVSEFLNRKDSDRKFYKSLPDKLIDEYEPRPPAQFKLQKNHLWGNIQKRWRRSKVNKRGNWPVQEELNVRGVPRSLGTGLGETGNSFDAYGQIGQNVEQALMKLNGGKTGCGQNQEMDLSTIASPENTPTFMMNGAEIQPDDRRQMDNGIIKIAPSRKRSNVLHYRSQGNPMLRNKRSLLLLEKRALQNALSKKTKALNTLKLQHSSVAGRSLSGHYAGGMPDTRPTETEEGITEDNEHENLEDKLSHDSTPLLMKIAQHDREDVNKLWTNKHSPGNGFYTGHGEGPNHPYLGDYFGHGPEEMLHDDGIKSLEESASPEDHHTATLIDSIWEHDLGEDHLGEHRIERHHGSEKIKNYFGGHHSSVMLPTETLDGIDTHWTGHLPHLHSPGYLHNDGHPIEFSPSRIKAIQAIQDDPLIDAELNPHDGIGTPLGHGHHFVHGYHHGNGHSFGGMNIAPYVNDQVHVDDGHEEEYKQHIDNLLSQYHGLEEHLRGTGGTLEGHMDPAAFAHHGTHHLHTGYDLYAYKNPWEGMKIPYHVPVSNHPMGQEEEPPQSPLTFEGKTDEKGGPVIEGGKEEGGKGGPLVEESKAVTEKGEKEKEGESPKGAKETGNKSPQPVIPKQRGGPEVSMGKHGKDEPEKEGKGKSDKEKEEKETKSENSDEKENKSATDDNEQTKDKGKEKHSKEEKQTEKDDRKEKEESTESKIKENDEKDLKKMVESMLNSTGKQSEMLNTLKEALGEEANNPKSVTALQLAKLKQLGAMQQTLLSSLAKQAKRKPKESLQGDSEGAGMSEIKQLLELQSLQQLGAGIKANALVNSLRQNSLLQSLKTAQDSLLRNIKQSTNLLGNNGVEKQDNEGLTQSTEIQKFFGKVPLKLLGSDLGNVGSEKLASRTHSLVGTSIGGGGGSIGELVHKLGRTRRPQKMANEASIKPMLNALLSESLLKTMKNKLKHSSKNTVNKENGENSTSDKVYSTIGNEGPTTATEETGHRRSTRERKKIKAKHKISSGGKKVDQENSTAVEKAEIVAFHEKDIGEDIVSKKNQVHH